MKTLFKILLVLMSSVLIVQNSLCQDRYEKIRQNLENLVIDQPGLDEVFESSVNGVSLAQFIRTIGINHKLNLHVGDVSEVKMVNTFSNARVLDVLVFLCKEYDLDVQLEGAIISFKEYRKPPPEPIPFESQLPGVTFNNVTGFLSLDLKKDTLEFVAREITKQTFTNVVLTPDVKDIKVSAYILNRPITDAIEKMCYANNLKVEQDGNFYLISKAITEVTETKSSGKDSPGSKKKSSNGNIQLSVKEGDLISVNCTDVPIAEIIDAVSQELLRNYFLYSVPQGNISLYIEDANYEQFLNYLLNGTKYTYRNQENVYLIGDRNLESLRTTELLKLKNRTIEKVRESIPQDLLTDVDIREFVELNAFVLSGSYPKIREIKDYITQIDQVVPVISIEVLIVDVNKSRTVSAGIGTGIGTPPDQTTGSITPSADLELSTETINNLINGFNGLGIVNLGNVTPNFYFNLQALETDGVLRTRSTPKLATLNGVESTMAIGRTEYYLETRNDIIGTQNPSLSQQQIWKSVNADLTIVIKPIVSSSEQVTLEITVSQTDFTERISETAPPGTVSRDFKSSIRVKNGEMILLGGLEDKSTTQSGTGLPWVSRVPVLKWFFGTHTRAKSDSKLSIFIRPTILY
jgi:type IV pilus assembly protein PilQ